MKRHRGVFVALVVLSSICAGQSKRPVPQAVTFAPATSIAGSNQETGIASGDLTNNRIQDLVLTDFYGGFFTALGNGDGTFRTFVSQGGAYFQLSTVVADINQDGILDFVIPDAIATYVYAFKGDGAGSTNANETLYAGPLASNGLGVTAVRGR